MNPYNQNQINKVLPKISSEYQQQIKQLQRRLTVSIKESNILQNNLSHVLLQNQEELQTEYLQKWQKQLKNQRLIYLLTQNLSFNRPIGQLGHTNSVLVNTTSNQDIQLFLPGYLRMKIKNLIDVNVGSYQTNVNAVIQFSINYGKLPRLLVDYLKQKIVMRFSKKNSIILKKTQQQNLSIKVIEQDQLQLISFTIHMPLTFHFQPYYPFQFLNLDVSIWLSPFEKIKTILTITVQQLVIRFDDLMCEFGHFYTKQQFYQVEHYFKKLKKYNGSIRKLIIKINLMNFIEPQLISTKSIENNKQVINDPQKCKEQTKRTHQLKFSKQVFQKYKQLACLYLDQGSQQENSLMNQCFFKNKSAIQNQPRVQELKQQLSILTSKNLSSYKLAYQEQHLTGQYQIVTSQLKVEYSCYKYLKFLKKKKLTQNKNYIQFLKRGTDKFAQKIQSNQRLIVENILFKTSRNQKQKQQEESPESGRYFCDHFMADDYIKRDSKEKLNNTFSILNERKIIQNVAQQINKSKQQVKNFHFAHFQLPIYKHPFVPLAIVFFPLWIIAFVNLIIYFEPRKLNDRIANIATLLISCVAYFPIFRQQIPSYRYLLLAQILAYLQIACSFLTIIHSLMQSDNQQRLTLQQVGLLFWISFFVTGITITIVLLGYLVHKCLVEPKYKMAKNLKRNIKLQTNALRHVIWHNFECDFAFLKKRNLRRLEQCEIFMDFLRQNYPRSKLKTHSMKFYSKSLDLN